MNNERGIKIMKKAVKILLGCAAVGTIATVVTKIVKDIENEIANEFEDEKTTEDFDRKVNDITPKE